MLEEAIAAAVREAIRPLTEKLDAVCAELRDLRVEVRELRTANSAQRDGAQASGVQIYLKPEDAAKALCVSRKTITRWINAGKLSHIKLPGGGIRIPVAAVEGLRASEDLAEAAE